jgi:hypothetical protein
MKIMPMGDYYVWYCEWCDTRNLTLWTRFEKDNVFCGACHRSGPIQGLSVSSVEMNRMASAIL